MYYVSHVLTHDLNQVENVNAIMATSSLASLGDIE